GHLGGQFSEQQGQSLRVYVFTASEYSSFSSGYNPQGLFLSDGPSSGTISVSFPAPGNYYVVFTHGTGYENSAQNFTFSINLDGYNPVMLGLGLGLLGSGVVLLVIGYLMRNKYLDEKVKAGASDVVMFDKPWSPPPPPSQTPP